MRTSQISWARRLIERVALAALTIAVLAPGAIWAAGNGAMPDAARDGDIAKVLELIAAGTDVNSTAPDGSTALLWAAYQSDLEMLAALLEAGADPDLANTFGVTPLLQASRTGNAPVMAALLDAGADANQRHPQGETALMAASRTGRIEAVRLLLERGADPNATDALEQQTALMWAAAEGHLDVVDALLDAGADPNRQARVSELTDRSINADFPTGGFSALMWAARNGDEDIVRRLVEGGADLDTMNGDGATAMMIAIVNDRFDMAATLLELGAGVGDGSLYYAVEMRDATTDWFARDGSRLRPDHPNKHTALDLIRVLLEAGADPNRPFVGQLHSYSMCCDIFANATPFYRAAVAADIEAMRLFIEHGADLAWTPSEAKASGARAANGNVGRSALVAAMNGGKGVTRAGGPGDLREGPPPFREPSNREPLDAVRLLLEAGANPDAALPSNGNTALHEAVRARKPEIIAALVEGGASADVRNEDGLTPLELAQKPDEGPPGPGAEPMPDEPRPSKEEIAAALTAALAARGQEPQ